MVAVADLGYGRSLRHNNPHTRRAGPQLARTAARFRNAAAVLLAPAVGGRPPRDAPKPDREAGETG
jgi:hypothetical protein